METIKKRKILILILCSILFAHFITYNIDSNLIAAEKQPLFVIKGDMAKDGGTTIYHGFGYSIIKWNRLASRIVNGERIDGVEVGYEICRLYKDVNDGPAIQLKFVSK